MKIQFNNAANEAVIERTFTTNTNVSFGRASGGLKTMDIHRHIVDNSEAEFQNGDAKYISDRLEELDLATAGITEVKMINAAGVAVHTFAFQPQTYQYSVNIATGNGATSNENLHLETA